MSKTWFEVDKRGLSKLLERRGKQFILHELLQNAWDEDVTEVAVRLEKAGRLYRLEVEDDSPEGFKDLSHAFTLFAESDKKHNAEKRGRFNLGEKLVLALCEEARIESTKGSVWFNTKEGRSKRPAKRSRGTLFTGFLKLTNAEFTEFDQAANRLLPPKGVKLTYNGEMIEYREPMATIDETLPTEIGDVEGALRSTSRKTTVEIVEPTFDEPAMLYEMGIPVVEHDGRWHLNIGQKVPLNMDRDNVTPSYLGKVRALVTDHMANELSVEDANAAWVRDAVTRHGEDMAPATIERLADLRFGEKRVAYDPSDPEANALAVSRGYTVVHGGSLNSAEWAAAKRVGVILPAGQVTPSPKPFHPDGRPLKTLDRDKYTDGIKSFVEYAKRIGKALMGVNVGVTIANDIGWRFGGAYGKGGDLTVNVATKGYKWFEGDIAPINEFLIHEFGHEYSGNHLSDEYHDALCRLGGKLSQLALEQPELFKR